MTIHRISFSRFWSSLLLVACSVVLTWSGLEGVSWLILRTGLVRADTAAELVTDTFPAAFRLDRALRIQIAGGELLRTQSALALDTFAFDPALGFRQVAYLRWYTAERSSPPADSGNLQDWWDKFAAQTHGHMVILCFGGSTTASGQPGNWPRYVADLLKLHGINRPAIVLNAGHNGFMTMQEQIWASYWILPELDRRGVVPDLALSLDGVNDIGYGVGGWQAYRRLGNEPWLRSYNGFHQFIDAYTRGLDHPKTALNAFGRAVLLSRTGHAWVEGVATVLPTTLALARRLGKHDDAYRPVAEQVLSWRMHNVMRLRDLYVAVPWSSGPLDPMTQAPYYEGSKVAGSLREVLALVERTGEGGARGPDVDLSALRAPDERNWTGLPDLVLPDEVHREILSAFQSNLLAFQSTFRGRDIPVISALQPIADHEVNPTVGRALGKDIPDFDYLLAHWAMQGMQPGALVRFPGRALYHDAQALYARMAARYPGGFPDLTRIFADATEDYFIGDNIHYTSRGSLRIAAAIVDACLAAGRCGKAVRTKLAPEAVLALATDARYGDDGQAHLVESKDGINIVRFSGRYWGIPQALGAVDWGEQDIASMPGVVVGESVSEIHRKLETTTVATSLTNSIAKPVPHLLGSQGTYNLVSFDGQVYGIPQALGAVRWGEENVAAMPGVIVAKTEDEVRRRVALKD